MRRVHWLLEHPVGPLVSRAFGVRLSKPWDEVPLSPLECIGRIRVPVLLVHGTADHYFPPGHAADLAAASATGPVPAELWLEPGMGHAESGARPELVDRVAGWVLEQLSAPAGG